jgi:hypothetical protein
VSGEELASLLAEADRCRRRLAGEDVEMGSMWGEGEGSTWDGSVLGDDRDPDDPLSPHATGEVAAAGSGL